MNIRIWGINYAPEFIGIGYYNTELAEFLSARSHRVTVVSTFPYYPAWKKRPEDRWRCFARDSRQGVDIVRCWHYVPGRVSAFRRICHEASFVFSSWLRQLFLPTPDLFVVVSPPLLLGWAAWLLTRFKCAPFVFHVQDLQPDAALKLGMLKPAWLGGPLYWLERFAYRKAACVSVISREMGRALRAKAVAADRIVLFPNWIALPGPLPGRAESKARLGLPAQSRVISYAGNLGEKQGVSLLAEVARLLRDEPDLLFIVAGGGPGKVRLQELKSAHGLDRLELRDLLPVEEHTCLLRASDLCLIPQRRGSGAAFLPSKLLKILACERPIVTNADSASALARAASEGGFGCVVDPDEPAALAREIRRLLASPVELERMGQSGCQYVMQFEKTAVLTAFEEVLRTCRG